MKRARRATSILAALVAIALSSTTVAAALDDLMASLAQRRHGVADFEQTQYLAMLKQPAHSSGVLTYDAPDRLEQRTLEPRPQSMLLDHGMLTLQRGSRRRTLRLEDDPAIASLIDSIRATLAGDRAALEQRFELTFDGNLDHWQLLLRPRAQDTAALVQHIRISGEHASILEVEVQQRDGDRSLMAIKPRE